MGQKIDGKIASTMMTTPVIIYPQGQIDSLGESVESPPVTYYGYVYEGIERIVNDVGEEVLSNMQIYLRGDEAAQIDIHSEVSCLDVVKSRIISRKVFRGRGGAKVIGVLYLP